MDWCGSVGEVRELYRSEWSVGYHWVIPKIFSMPDRIGPIYYSPTFKFLNMTWCLGIYRCSMVGDKEWIGLDIRRSSHRLPVPALFSVGVMLADKSEYLLHRNKNFPSRDSVCSINDFLLKSTLREVREKLAPSDELTITCVLWPDVPASGECKVFYEFEQNMNPEGQTHPHKKERKDAVTKGDVSLTKDRSCILEIVTKSTEESNKPTGSDGKLREISSRDELFNRSMPSQTTQEASDPDFSHGRRKDYVRSSSESAISSKEFSQSAQYKNSRKEARAHIKGKEFSQSTQNSGGESRDHKRGKEFSQSAQKENSGGKAHAHKKATKNHASGTEDVPVTQDESECVETETKAIAASDKPFGNSSELREVSRGVKWDIRLPPSKKTWVILSPEFTCEGLKYYFRLYSNELCSDDIYLGFIVNITNFPLPIRWRMAVKRRGLAGLRWVMNGQRWITTGYERQCYKHTHEVCIKRAELECSMSPDCRLTFVHYLSFGEVDEQQEASTQTDKTVISRETQTEDQIGGTVNLEDFEEQLTLRLTDPEKGDYVHLIQKKPLDPSVEKFFSELPRDDKKDFIFAA